jgi:hypothetical protein
MFYCNLIRSWITKGYEGNGNIGVAGRTLQTDKSPVAAEADRLDAFYRFSALCPPPSPPRLVASSCLALLFNA